MAEGTIGQLPTGEAMAYLKREPTGYQALQERKQGEGEPIEVDPVNTYRAEIEEFADAIIHDREPMIPGEEGLWNLRIILAAYESARERRAVEIDFPSEF